MRAPILSALSLRSLIRLLAAVAVLGTLSVAPSAAQNSPPPGTLPPSGYHAWREQNPLPARPSQPEAAARSER